MDDSVQDDESSDALYYSAEEGSFSDTFFDALSDCPITEL